MLLTPNSGNTVVVNIVEYGACVQFAIHNVRHWTILPCVLNSDATFNEVSAHTVVVSTKLVAVNEDDGECHFLAATVTQRVFVACSCERKVFSKGDADGGQKEETNLEEMWNGFHCKGFR